jgi:hypothetical protein
MYCIISDVLVRPEAIRRSTTLTAARFMRIPIVTLVAFSRLRRASAGFPDR